MSDFYGINLALSSLFAQRRAIEIAGQNVANANTDGYTRQRIEQGARGAGLVPAIHSTWKGGGGGVDVLGIERLRNAFFELRAAQEHGNLADLETMSRVYARMELVFNEPSDTGIQAQLADFWAGWHDVSNRPDDLAARTQLLERARTLATGFNQAASGLSRQWDSSLDQLETIVSEVNSLGSRIAELNSAIIRASQGGLSPNELADQRDLLVSELSELIGITVRPADHGAVDVLVGGTALVQGAIAENLAVDTPAGTTILNASTSPVRILWAKDSFPAAVSGGQVGGLLTALNTVLPDYRSRLDSVTQNLTDVVNNQHVLGVDLNGAAGTNMFSFDPLTGLSVLITDPAEIAAATAGSGLLDGGNAIALANLATLAGGPDEEYQSLVISLGVDTQVTNRRVDIQADITRQIDGIRDSEAGVNLDEEMANLVAFQRAYEAGSRFLTTIDSMLDTLINRTGLVGR
ncbi:MAG TPA: flagellar hook-associated protein FlgK [Acidimicrobiia bacterium]|nr:flagellar hook-associated protein FlgK [Acidimicrobiia bacterium]